MKEHATAIAAHASKHDDLDSKLHAAQKAQEQARAHASKAYAARHCGKRVPGRWDWGRVTSGSSRQGSLQALARLNTLTTENAVMSAQLSSSTADVARLTTSNDKWQQMYDTPALHTGCEQIRTAPLGFIMTFMICNAGTRRPRAR